MRTRSWKALISGTLFKNEKQNIIDAINLFIYFFGGFINGKEKSSNALG